MNRQPEKHSTSVKDDAAIITHMTLAEATQAMVLAEREGWNPGLHDAETFHAANPGGLLCLHSHGICVGYASVMNYDQNYAFFGLYIVEEAFRGKGYGMAITQRRLKMAGNRCIGLDGVPENVDIYARIGFRPNYRHLRYAAGRESANRLEAITAAHRHRDIRITPLSTISSHLLHAFDQQFFPAHRGHFLKIWNKQPDIIALAALQQEKLVGYIVIRPCVHGCKAGPLFAESQAAAELLLASACARASRLPLYIDIPEPNLQALEIADRSHMQQISETMRMHIGTPHSFNLSGVYGVTSLEMG